MSKALAALESFFLMDISPTVVSCLAGIVLGLVSYTILAFFERRRDRMLRRAGELRSAAKALNAHYETLFKFLDAPEAPEALKTMLLWFSDAAADHDVASALARSICSEDTWASPSASSQAFIKDLDELTQSSPKLADLFQTVIASGLYAMFLRWDDTSPLLEVYQNRRVTVSARHDVTIAHKVAKAEERAASSRVPSPASRLVPA